MQNKKDADKVPGRYEDGKSAEDAFWDVLREANFNFPVRGHAMSGRWARMLANNPKMRDQYSKLKSHQAKEEMRKDWASKKFDEYKANKKLVTTDEHINFSKGKYMAVGRIAWIVFCSIRVCTMMFSLYSFSLTGFLPKLKRIS